MWQRSECSDKISEHLFGMILTELHDLNMTMILSAKVRYARAVDLAQFYRKNARGTLVFLGTASIFAWFCTRSRGHGQQRDPAKTSGRRPLRKRCRFTIDPQVQYLLVEGTALGEYASQALKGSDAAQPTGCSASLVPCVANETIDSLTTGVIYLYSIGMSYA